MVNSPYLSTSTAKCAPSGWSIGSRGNCKCTRFTDVPMDVQLVALSAFAKKTTGDKTYFLPIFLWIHQHKGFFSTKHAVYVVNSIGVNNWLGTTVTKPHNLFCKAYTIHSRQITEQKQSAGKRIKFTTGRNTYSIYKVVFHDVLALQRPWNNDVVSGKETDQFFPVLTKNETGRWC